MAYLGENIPKLGFGLMRLPTLEKDVIDIEQTKVMVDKFIEAGFTYFDTAYVYNNSEKAAKAALVDRYPRESFQLATKLPLWSLNEETDLQEIFNTHLERTGAGYFDFYLLHNLTGDSIEKAEKFGAWDFIKGLKEKGLVKHIGFSCHDTPEKLDDILTKHPEAEFVQLQINYLDWENPDVRSRECWEVARRHGKPVIIMEPVKGGSLAGFAPEIQSILTDADPDASVASWAVRFAASLEGLVTVLSGMSSIAQVEDNTSFMKNFKPMTDADLAVVNKVVDAVKAVPQIPCTACRYCVDGCPQSINIPGIFRSYNDYMVYHNEKSFKNGYERATSKGGKAADCLQCGACEGHCPQHINIIERLAEISKFVG